MTSPLVLVLVLVGVALGGGCEQTRRERAAREAPGSAALALPADAALAADAAPIDPADPLACAADADCALIERGCCGGCAGGAIPQAVRVTFVERMRAAQREGCAQSPTRCPSSGPIPPEKQPVACKMRAGCREGQCALVAVTPPPPVNVPVHCQVDADCALMNEACCGCGATPVRADAAPLYAQHILERCLGAICAAVVDERPICWATAACDAGRCVARIPEARARRDRPPAPAR